MTDSIEKIVAEMEALADEIAAANINGFGNSVRNYADRLAALPSDKGEAGEPLSHCVHGMPTKDFCAQCASNRQVNKWLAETAPYDCPARPDSGWVPIESGLPPMDTPVWARLKSGDILQCERNDCGEGWLWGNCYGSAYVDKDGKWKSYDCEQDDDYEVTHWMPLPPQPNAEGVG